MAAQPGMLLRMDGPEHLAVRRMVAKHFTVRKIASWEARIAALVEHYLDEMESAESPANLVSAFALPIPSIVISDLLGVPERDRTSFQKNSEVLIDLAQPQEIRGAAAAAMQNYVYTLVQAARDSPGGDILGELVRDHGAELSDAEITTIGFLLLIARHETTANMIALGAVVLMEHPEQLKAMLADPEAVGPAVEELLRYLSVVTASLERTATEDIDIAGHHISAGDYVTFSLLAANRDPAQLGNPDSFDISRRPTAHTAFGFGPHHCLGQQLARLELRIAFPALFRRFPHLRLEKPATDLDFRKTTFVYGLWDLPVAW
ncbi:cytochrome P450 [Paenarthrobacter sp. Z7-10]|uniref:cytochrome P450 n=1 Tax=Paenarthrobacter sp. Z7-10 TaxID=2787635 RepID=UPI0022A8F2A3|nr:cytochrome P450 [Paenarthrobacter sp. Z7-10]MCZ2403631.1 cytochrome P450 [Paenarthrobacter sp. Z7-10]